MGKKHNKKNRDLNDCLDLSPEAQKEGAIRLDAYEDGEISFLEYINYTEPTSTRHRSDFSRQLEYAYMSKATKDEIEQNYYREENDNNDDDNDQYTDRYPNNYNDDEYYYDNDQEIKEPDDITDDVMEEYIQSYHINNETDENVNEYEDTNKMNIEPPIYIPQIHCRYDDITRRVIIDDDAIQTNISLVYSTAIDIKEELIPDDMDEFSTLVSRIFFYIITCKHPSVIVTENAFAIEFGKFKEINSDRILFFRHNGLVYIYILDEYMRDNFYSITDIAMMDKSEFIKYLIGASFISNNMNNKFMSNDEDEVDVIMDERHDIKNAIKYIEQNFDVVYMNNDTSNCGDPFNRLKVFNYEKFVTGVRYTIDDFAIEDEEDDDDEEIEYDDYNYEMVNENDDVDVDEVDEEADDVDINDFPIDDDNDTLMENTETVENTSNIEKVATTNTSSNENMTMPIIHRQGR